MDITQLTSNDSFINAHNHLLNCNWKIVGFGVCSVSYKYKSDKLEIFGLGDELLFKMNNEKAKDLTEDNLIRTILF